MEEASNMVCPVCGKTSVYYLPDGSYYIAKCINCNHYIKRGEIKKVTNGEVVRKMSDDELVDFILMPQIYAPWCVENGEECRFMFMEDYPCEICLKDWLQKEVE